MATGNQAEELWVRVERNPTMRREALDNLRQLYRAKDERPSCTQFSNGFMKVRLPRAPITADLARLGLNLGENTESSHQLAKEAYDPAAPNDVDFAVTYAFSLHRLARDAEALAIIRSLPPERLHDAHAAGLRRAGARRGKRTRGEQRTTIATAENGQLYPEETTADRTSEDETHRGICKFRRRQSSRRPVEHRRCNQSSFSIASVQSAMSFSFI